MWNDAKNSKPANNQLVISRKKAYYLHPTLIPCLWITAGERTHKLHFQPFNLICMYVYTHREKRARTYTTVLFFHMLFADRDIIFVFLHKVNEPFNWYIQIYLFMFPTHIICWSHPPIQRIAIHLAVKERRHFPFSAHFYELNLWGFVR